jgi:hypothetical protein
MARITMATKWRDAGRAIGGPDSIWIGIKARRALGEDPHNESFPLHLVVRCDFWSVAKA